MSTYVYQNPNDLVFDHFPVVRADLDDLLTVYQDRTLDLGAVVVRVAIIGESHFLTVSGEINLTELLICSGIPSLSDMPQGCRHDKSYTRNGWKVESRVWASKPLSLLERERAVNAHTVYGEQVHLSQAFPGGSSPRTIVTLRHTDDSIEVRTVHEYEREHGIEVVFSKTTLCRRSTS